MKRIIMLMVIMLVLSASAWAGGDKEIGVLTLGVRGGDREATFDRDGNPLEKGCGVMHWRDVILADFPYEVEIRNYAADNTNIKMEADITGGDPPDVYWDYQGRVNAYANEEFAVPIKLTKEELADYIPSSLASVTKGGQLYALPGTAWAAIMVVNKTLVESVEKGHLLPADNDLDRSWTIADYLEIVEAMQDKYGPEYYGYVLFASGTGGDYWGSFGWLAAFGAKLYEDGEIVIGSTAGIRALNFMKMMHDTGIAMPGAAGLTYQPNLAAMAEGNIVAAGNVMASAIPTKLVDESGMVDVIIMEYPHAMGVKQVPIAIGPDAGMVFVSGNKAREKASMEMLRYLNTTEVQQLLCAKDSRFASRYSVGNVLEDDWNWIVTTNMIAENGVFDTGVGLRKYAEVRNSWPPTLQAIFTGELSVQEAVDRFVNEGAMILESK